MIAVGGPKVDTIMKIIEENSAEIGLDLKFQRKMGLLAIYTHNAEDDDTAKSKIKSFLGNVQELKGKMITVKAVDENGAFL